MKVWFRAGGALAAAVWLSAAIAQAGEPPSPGRSVVSDPRLSRLIDFFETRTLPFEVSEIPDFGEEVDDWEKEEFFGLDLEEGVYNDIFPLGVFFEPGYVGLTLLHLVTPGVAQSFDSFLQLRTFGYDGTPIARVELGCFCRAANLGTGASHDTWLKARFDRDGVVVATLTTDRPGSDEDREMETLWEFSSFRIDEWGGAQRRQ